jgi:hypothetical protein
MSNSNKLAKIDKFKIGELLSKMPSKDILDFFRTLSDAYKESQITKREIEKIHAIRDVLITQIKSKEKTLNKICDLIFEERKNSINEIFSVIHKGIDSGNDAIITKGLESLATIVSSSPFKDINVLSNLLENQGKIEM